ncbi:Os09g0505850 [Oryza sativa Japonica Group]|uniref:Os09g0505850 protein n=1 Tax=Oryza sativa subsp. japonica TaxID=39947 RepID=A0A0P0XPV2_ORYSJ|nr:hypothetical protein EE612_048807 [Oryza sativa]BAT08856.1 Os09g0505850 [Oryza sativa Japonica Group]
MYLLAVHCLQHDVLESCQFLFLYNKHAMHSPYFHHCNTMIHNETKNMWYHLKIPVGVIICFSVNGKCPSPCSTT